MNMGIVVYWGFCVSWDFGVGGWFVMDYVTWVAVCEVFFHGGVTWVWEVSFIDQLCCVRYLGVHLLVSLIATMETWFGILDVLVWDALV